MLGRSRVEHLRVALIRGSRDQPDISQSLDVRDSHGTWHHVPVLTPDPSPPVSRDSLSRRSLSRRSLFRIAATGTLGLAFAPILTGCSEDDVADVREADQLLEQARLARRDAASAAAAVTVLPDRANALTTISAQRSAHAEALEAEIARAAGTYADGSTPTTATSAPESTTTGPTAPPTPPSVEQLRSELTESQQAAADLAAKLSRHRAGLMASISAACATHVVVLLP